MSKINQYSAAEKLAILQELETNQTTLLDIARKYDINKSTLINWRHRYELNGYKGLENRSHNKIYSAEFKIQIVQDYLSGNYSQFQIIDKYKIASFTQVRNWIKKYKQVAENLLNREFTAAGSNEKWLTDVTEFKYGNGQKAYLSAILDLHDKAIVAYVLGHSNNNSLVFETLDLALQIAPGSTPMIHSDRGFQYTSWGFKKRLESRGLTQSMSRIDQCIDNGPMEGFWGTLKCEKYLYS